MKDHLVVGLTRWRDRAIKLCRRRGWSLRWDVRLAQHVLECSELAEAVRGKHGSIVEEAGDMLFTALAMIPEDVDLASVLSFNEGKVDVLLEKPQYVGESRGDPQ